MEMVSEPANCTKHFQIIYLPNPNKYTLVTKNVKMIGKEFWDIIYFRINKNQSWTALDRRENIISY